MSSKTEAVREGTGHGVCSKAVQPVQAKTSSPASSAAIQRFIYLHLPYPVYGFSILRVTHRGKYFFSIFKIAGFYGIKCGID